MSFPPPQLIYTTFRLTETLDFLSVEPPGHGKRGNQCYKKEKKISTFQVIFRYLFLPHNSNIFKKINGHNKKVRSAAD